VSFDVPTIVKFGDLSESTESRVTVVPYRDFIAFDVANTAQPSPVLVVSNISVEEAKSLRDALGTAIQDVEKQGAM
jgi:hypothetical protein